MPPFKRSLTIDGSGVVSRPLVLERANSVCVLPHPATRRVRAFSMGGKKSSARDLVYVGPNPIIKKEVKDLRKKRRTSDSEKVAKPIPKSASKTNLKQAARGRSSRRERANLTSSDSSSPKAPRRKASNPFLKGELVGQSPSPNKQNKILSLSPMKKRAQSGSAAPALTPLLSPVRTVSQSRRKPQATRTLSLGAPKAPSRKASIPDIDMAAGTPSLSPVMTRSWSRQKLQASLSLDPSMALHSKESTPLPHLSRSITFEAPSMPHRRKASNPFLRGGLVGQNPSPNKQKAKSLSPMKTCSHSRPEVPALTSSLSPVRTGSQSRRKPQATRILSLEAPMAPSGKASILDIDMAARVPSRKASIPDIDMAAALRSAAPAMPHRKASNPFLRKGLVTCSPVGNELIKTRSRSRQKIKANISMDAHPCSQTSIPPVILAPPESGEAAMPHRKASNPSLQKSRRTRKPSIRDIEWNKLSLVDAVATQQTNVKC